MFTYKKVAGVMAAIGLLGCSVAIAKSADAPAIPKRVLIVVMDQMRPEYAEKFDMKNVKKLTKEGVHFKNGYLGHLASHTVISHNVMVSGIFPKRMGWADDAHRDVRNLLGKGHNAMWESGGLSMDQFGVLISDKKYPKLADYLHLSRPGSKFIVVSEKNYIADSVVAPNGDIAVRMSDRVSDVSKEKGCDNLGGAWRYPYGKNVPVYLSEPKCGRFYINSDKANDYGTLSISPAWTYPHDGNRMMAGNDLEHLGGDVWVADAAMTLMENEDWSGMMVSFGAIDKAGHMWGAQADKEGELGSIDEQTHVPNVARLADEQFGRLLEKLSALDQLKETIIVITADHGGEFAENFYGLNAPNSSGISWGYGVAANGGNPDKPLAVIKPLVDTGNLQYSVQATSIDAFLKDNSEAKKREMAQVMRKLPDIVTTYWRDGDHYVLDAAPGQGTSANFTPDGVAWWKAKGQYLMDTMAAEYAADVVGVGKEKTAYGGAVGEHGSFTEADQRIPMIIWGANIKAEKPAYEFRSVDILPTVLKAMNIPLAKPVDGKAYPVKFKSMQ